MDYKDWIKRIPARINEDKHLELMPENGEIEKNLVEQVTPDMKKAFEYAISNNFPGTFR